MARILVWASEQAGASYAQIFRDEGHNTLCSTDIGCIEQSAMLVLIGGCDVYPPLYQEPVGEHTRFTAASTAADIEILRKGGAIDEAREKNKAIVGICKGSQLLCVAYGGKLIQHVEHHPGNHNISCSGGETFLSKGGHHQVASPSEEGRVIGYYQDEEGTLFPEITYYREHAAWGVQYHPEYHSFEERGRRYFMEKVALSLAGACPFPLRERAQRLGGAPAPRARRAGEDIIRNAALMRELAEGERIRAAGNAHINVNEAFDAMEDDDEE